MHASTMYALCALLLVGGVHGQAEFAGYAPPPAHVEERPAGPLVLSEVGDVFSFGDGSTGQLGLGPSSLMTTPRMIEALPRGKIYMASAGYAHSVAVTETGEIYTWGNNAFGQLGFRNLSIDFTIPSQVSSLGNTRVVFVCAGFAHTVAVTDQGVTFAWGSNSMGQLGLEGFTATYTPTVVTGLVGKKVVRVSCGYANTVAVTDHGIVYTFGDNSMGQLGLGHIRPMSGVNQVTVLGDYNIVQAEVGWTHVLAMTDDGQIFGWGDNSVGQLGLGYKDSPILEVTPIQRLRDKGVFYLATGYFHNFVLTDSGMVFGFGSNDHGQLGIYDKYDRDIPTAVPLLRNNRVYAFGSNAQGQLGTANFEDRVRPTAVEMDNKRVYEVLAGYQFSLILAQSCADLPDTLLVGERDVEPTFPSTPTTPSSALRGH